MFIQHIGATGLQNITDGDESYISCVEFTVYGFTGSMVPQCVQMTDGPTAGLLAAVPNYFNCGYVNANTGVGYAAGTAITTDGRYIIDTTGAKFALNVTDAGDGDFYVYGKPLAGPAPSFASGGGGGGGGAVTVADGADVTLGANADAAVGDATGTVNAHLRQIAKMATGAADNSTDSTNKLPVLAGTANAAAQSWTEGRQVPISTDLAGNARVIPAATEAHLGQVGGATTVIKPTATVSTSPAYTSGDDAGGKLTISSAVRVSGGTGVFQGLQLFFKSGTAPTGVFLLFDADPSAATITDNTAFAWSTDQAKCIGMISVISTDLITVGSQIIAKPSFTPFPVKAASGTTLYAAYVLTSTPTFTATTDMLVEIGILQD